MTRPVQAERLAQAEAALAAAEPALAALIASAGPCDVGLRRHRSHFESLARSIVYQQLAGRAAASIWRRVRALVPGPFTAAAVVGLAPEDLRTAGLSAAKARAMHDLAARVVDGRLRLASVARLPDERVVGALSEVWGVGRWTAEMFLMFQLGRLDVWPTGDLGVRNGFARAFSLPAPPAPRDLEVMGDRFRPWRSVVAWYCWRAADAPVPDV